MPVVALLVPMTLRGPCHASRFLLTDVLRDGWGFNGLIVADYAGINLLYAHHGIARDQAEAAALML